MVHGLEAATRGGRRIEAGAWRQACVAHQLGPEVFYGWASPVKAPVCETEKLSFRTKRERDGTGWMESRASEEADAVRLRPPDHNGVVVQRIAAGADHVLHFKAAVGHDVAPAAALAPAAA